MVSVGINTFIELWKEILLNGILNFIAKAFDGVQSSAAMAICQATFSVCNLSGVGPVVFRKCLLVFFLSACGLVSDCLCVWSFIQHLSCTDGGGVGTSSLRYICPLKRFS